MKKGNTLIECMAGISIFVIAILIISKASGTYYKTLNFLEREKQVERVIEAVEREVQFNTKLCEVVENLKEEKYIKLNKNILEDILDRNILEILSFEKGEIALEIVEILEDSLALKVKIGEFSYEFKKEKWMEM